MIARRLQMEQVRWYTVLLAAIVAGLVIGSAAAVASGPLAGGGASLETADPPEIVAVSPDTDEVKVATDGSQTFEISVASDDADDLEIEWTVAGTTVGTGSSITYSPDDRGSTHTLTVTVQDEHDETADATHDWSIDVRQPPEITDVDPESEPVFVEVSDFEEFSVSATDPDGGPLTYDWTIDDGAPITDAGSSLRPAISDRGTQSVTVSVSDETDVTDPAEHTWTVVGVTEPSIDAAEPDDEAVLLREGESRSFSVSASAQGTADSHLEYRWQAGTGTSAERLAPAASFQLQADDLGVGEHTVQSVVGYDAAGTPDTVREWEVTVAGPPTVSSITPTEAEAGTETTFEATVSDHDSGPGIETVSWEIEDQEYTGEQATHTFDTVGNYTVQVTAETADGVTVTKSERITVESAIPTLEELSLENGTTLPAGEHEVSASATLPDDQSLSMNYTWETPYKTTIGPEAELEFDRLGEQRVTLRLETEHGVEVEHDRVVTVERVSPSIEPLTPGSGVTSFKKGESERIAAHITNPELEQADARLYVDGDQVAETSFFDPEITYEEFHEFDRVGNVRVELVVVDGGGATESVQWEGTVIGEPVEITDHTPAETPLSVRAGDTVAFDVDAVDPAGGSLTYRWYQNGSVQQLNGTYEQRFTDPGETTVRVVAENDIGQQVEREWTVQVRDFRVQPEINDQTTGMEIDPTERSTTFVSITASNPDVNDRPVRVELDVDIADGLSVSGTRNVEEVSGSDARWAGVVEPGQQHPLRLEIQTHDEALFGDSVTIPYTVRYHPVGAPEAYTVSTQETATIEILDPDASTDRPDQAGRDIVEEVDGFGVTTMAIALAVVIGSLHMRRDTQ